MKHLALIDNYRRTLELIPKQIRDRVNKPGGLNEETLLDVIFNPHNNDVFSPSPPQDNFILREENVEKLNSIGERIIDSGEIAYCILAGGAGTRIGEPKSLLRIPQLDVSLLELKLQQAPGTGPIWVITSPTLYEKTLKHLEAITASNPILKSRVELIEQYESYRLNLDNTISFLDGAPELYPCGHGDVFQLIARSEALTRFVSAGGKHISIVNVDNIHASLDPTIIGRHRLSKMKVSCEVVLKSADDSGGVLCDVDGSLQIVESFRIHDADLREFKWLNTNSFIVDVDIDFLALGARWNRVRKIVQGRTIVQHERLLQEVTAAYETAFLAIERHRRFLPIKNSDDLITASRQLGHAFFGEK